MTSRPPRSAKATLPFVYRHTLITLEPIFAVLGCLTVLRDPAGYLKTMTAAPTPPFDARTGFLYTQLAAAWAVFAFNEAVLLRMFDDLRLWKALSWGMLLSDVLFAHSSAQGLGGWAEWVRVSEWQSDDWSVILSTIGPLVVRLLIVLEVGFKRQKDVKEA